MKGTSPSCTSSRFETRANQGSTFARHVEEGEEGKDDESIKRS